MHTCLRPTAVCNQGIGDMEGNRCRSAVERIIGAASYKAEHV